VAVVLLLSGCQAGASGGERHVAEREDVVPAGSTVGFYGDSLTFGLGASDPSRRWATLLCVRRGWTEANPSVSGIGFVKARAGTDLPGQIIAAHPDLVVVALGHNDLLLVDSRGSEVEAAIHDDLTRLRNGLPDARIVVLALFSPLSFEPPQVTAVDGWLRAAARDVGATFVPKSSGWLVGHPDWTVDGIHFSDAGNAAIADLLDAELTRVL
jgi:lysophospholipase L1-like esterase